MSSFAEDVHQTLRRVISVLDELSVPWAIGGSLSSSLHGEPRSTNDIDLVALLQPHHASMLVDRLGAGFYADREMIADAIRRRSSFNLIDDETILKVDIFVPPPGALGSGQLDRRRRVQLAPALEVWVLGPEDTVLQKMKWYRLGGSTSERQWQDICDVLRVQAGRLDFGYLRQTADAAGFGDDLDRALSDAADAGPR